MVNPMILAEDGKSIGNMLTQQFVGKKINDTKKGSKTTETNCKTQQKSNYFLIL